jgi:hypothetical protein
LQTGLLSTNETTSQSAEKESKDTYIVVRLRAGYSLADPAVLQIAERFQLKRAELQTGISTAGPLPLTITSREEVSRLLDELQAYGFETFSIQESDLQTRLAERKIRALEFTEMSLNGLTTSPVQQVRAYLSDLALIVSGRLYTSRVEVDERPSRDAVKHLDRREFTQDEPVIDLYAKSGEAWRISVNDFDFSCLGQQKSLTTFDNVRGLIELLTRRSDAELNEAYARMRPLLTAMWPLEVTTSKSRSRQPRAGRKDVSVVTGTGNTTQFSNYSRLAWAVKVLELKNRPA